MVRNDVKRDDKFFIFQQFYFLTILQEKNSLNRIKRAQKVGKTKFKTKFAYHSFQYFHSCLIMRDESLPSGEYFAKAD